MDPIITLWGHFEAPYFKMLNDASVASAGSYIRTCRRIRNSKKIATIRDFHQNICVNPTNTYFNSLWLKKYSGSSVVCHSQYPTPRGRFRGGATPLFFCRDRASDFVWAPQEKRMRKSCELTLKFQFFSASKGHIPLRHPQTLRSVYLCSDCMLNLSCNFNLIIKINVNFSCSGPFLKVYF